MWPFSSRAAPKRTVPMVPWPGSGPAGGDPFWSWGSLGASYVSPQAAENLAAVLCSVNIISATIAGLPASIVRANDQRDEVPGHPLQRLIDLGANSNESWSDFLELLLASALLRGNALAEIATADNGRLMGLRSLPW